MTKFNPENPECFGKRKRNRRCPNCPFDEACRIYSATTQAEKSGTMHLHITTVSLNEFMNPRTGELDNLPQLYTYADPSSALDNDSSSESNGELDPAKVNLKLLSAMVMLAIEKPRVAEAYILKLNGCQSLSDVAEICGIRRQAVYKAIKKELGLGKRNYEERRLAALTERERLFYQLIYGQKLSTRQIAAKMGIGKSTVSRIGQQIKAKLNKVA